MFVQSGFSLQSGRLPKLTDIPSNVPGVLNSNVEKEDAACVTAASRPKIRKTRQEKCPTPKMMKLIEQESAKIEEKFAYEKWKVYIKEVHTKLKYQCYGNSLYNMMATTKKLESEVGEFMYNCRSK